MSPGATRHLVELLPIGFAPCRHTISLYALLMRLDAARVQKVHRGLHRCLLVGHPPTSELFIYITESPVEHFPHLLYQTRYGGICFVGCFLKLPTTMQRVRYIVCELASCERYLPARGNKEHGGVERRSVDLRRLAPQSSLKGNEGPAG